MDKTTHEKIKQCEQERERMVTRIFWNGLEIALIFGLPVALGIFIGKQFEVESFAGIMIGTFIFSWIILIFRYRSTSRKIQNIETKIKELKKILEQESEQQTE